MLTQIQPTATAAVRQEELEAFEADGYLVKRGLLPADLMERIDKETGDLHETMAVEEAYRIPE